MNLTQSAVKEKKLYYIYIYNGWCDFPLYPGYTVIQGTCGVGRSKMPGEFATVILSQSLLCFNLIPD